MASNFIEIKGPFQIKDRESAQKIKTQILKLAKEHPKAKFILREAKRARGSGSVYSAAFQSLAESKQAKRAHVVKQIFTKSKGLNSPAKVREAKITSLKPFKQVEFTFSGDIVTPEYSRWRDVDISLSKQQVWDPLRSKGQHFQSFEGYNKDAYLVPKFKGGKSTATKKIDALIDRISEYGRKKGAKRESVDAGIQYIFDKAGQFEEEQRFYKKKGDPHGGAPINMLTDARIERLERLRKNYGTPPKLTGSVNVINKGKKKIVPQVAIQTDPHKIYRSNVKTSTKGSPDIDALKRWKGRVKDDGTLNLPESKKGQVGTGLVEGGPETSHDPVGIKRRPDSARQFDETAIQSSPENEILYPEQSSERQHFEADSTNKKQWKNKNPNVHYDEYPLKKIKVVKKKYIVPKYSAAQSIHAKLTNPKFTQFPDIISGSKKLSKKMKNTLKREYAKRGLRVEKGGSVVHPTSKMTSGLAQFENLTHKGHQSLVIKMHSQGKRMT